MKKQTLLLGAHMSIAGGVQNSVERGESIGCTTIQIFTKSNRQWAGKKVTDEEIAAFKAHLKKSPIQCVVDHASYLINIASSDNVLAKKSVHALEQEITNCSLLGIPYIVLHPGSATGISLEEGIDNVARNLDLALEQSPHGPMVLLELMAGQGSSLGSTFEQLAEIYKKVHHKKRIGFCLDTCHAFAAGYDFRTPETYQKMWHDFDTILGLEHLKVIHINDSKKELGSHVDRHEHIGKGQLGTEPFKLLFNDPRFFDIPKILETPKDDDMADDIENMKTIRNLLNSRTKEILGVV